MESEQVKLRVGTQVQKTPEEGRRTYQPKRCGNSNKDEDNSLKTLNNSHLFTHNFMVSSN